MADKQTKLSIVIRTVDQATAKIKAINDKLDAVTKPFRDFKEQLGDLRSKSGLDDVIGGFQGVGSAITEILGKVLMLGGAIAAAAAGLITLIGEFDDLGDLAEKIGFNVDALAQLRHAAVLSGASVEQLDGGLQSFSKSLGQLRAGTGRMAGFLGKVSPALLKQLKGAKDNEQAFDLLANAMAKIEDPAKRAALASATVGDAALAPMLAKGAMGIGKLRMQYAATAGTQHEAVEAAGEFGDAMDDLKAATDGVKAALVANLAPALKVVVERLKAWLVGHRADIAVWAKELGERLPGAIRTVADWLGAAYDKVTSFVEGIGGLKTVAIAVGAVLVGPLLSAITTLGTALLTTPIGWIVTGIAGAALLLIKYWEPIKDFFATLWDGITWVFEEAWKVIKGIVDQVVAAVDWVSDKVGFVSKSLHDVVAEQHQLQKGGGENWVQSAIATARGTSSSSEAKVTVDFANAPRGTRVTTDPRSTADVDTSLGIQMLGAWP